MQLQEAILHQIIKTEKTTGADTAKVIPRSERLISYYELPKVFCVSTLRQLMAMVLLTQIECDTNFLCYYKNMWLMTRILFILAKRQRV